MVVLSSVPAMADTVDNKKQADALFLAGREALNKGNFAGACAKFFEAQKLETNNVAILLNLGLCNEKQGKNATALRWYRKTQTAASERNDPALKEYEDTAKAQTSALANQVSHVTFNLGPLQPEALLFIDGETIDRTELTREVDKGKHVIEARLPGKKTSHDELIVEDNNKNLTFTFKMLEEAPLVGNRRRRQLKGALIGGAIILVASAVTGFWAYGIKKDFDDKVDANESPKKQDFLDKMLPASLIWGGGVAAGIGIAAYFYFTAPPGERQEEAGKTAFAPTVTNSSVGFSMFRRF